MRVTVDRAADQPPVKSLRLMLFLYVVLALLAVAGHVTVWVTAVNRIHAVAIPRWIIGGLTVVSGAMLLVPLALGVANPTMLSGSIDTWPWYASGYLALCWAVALGATAERVWHIRRQRHDQTVLDYDVTMIDLPAKLGGWPVTRGPGRWLAHLPGNQALHLALHRETLTIRRLDPALDGLTIAHLSDFHMSGRIGAEFYREIVAQTNQLEPDLVAITGDLFDHADCLEWGCAALAELKSRYGVFFILGNHDVWVDPERIRTELSGRGLIDLGGKWQSIDIRGRPLVLAGNELPWLVPAADMEHCPVRFDGRRGLRILLSHSPDQIDWAQGFDFDLMLAGHTHGGQIRLPVLGSVVVPSRLGTRCAEGIYDRPPTTLHVSRGVSSLTLLRWNCPPELALLVLRDASQSRHRCRRRGSPCACG